MRRRGNSTTTAKGVICRFGSRTVAFMIALSLISRRSKSKKNDAFLATIGPLKLPPYKRDSYGARVLTKGLRELNI